LSISWQHRWNRDVDNFLLISLCISLSSTSRYGQHLVYLEYYHYILRCTMIYVYSVYCVDNIVQTLWYVRSKSILSILRFEQHNIVSICVNHNPSVYLANIMCTSHNTSTTCQYHLHRHVDNVVSILCRHSGIYVYQIITVDIVIPLYPSVYLASAIALLTSCHL
jgi:hypothetical protein